MLANRWGLLLLRDQYVTSLAVHVNVHVQSIAHKAERNDRATLFNEWHHFQGKLPIANGCIS